MRREGKHILETVERYAQPPYDYLTDDMTVPFAIALAEKDTEIERLRAQLLRQAMVIGDMRSTATQLELALTEYLEDLKWKPRRSHIERARNDARRIALTDAHR